MTPPINETKKISKEHLRQVNFKTLPRQFADVEIRDWQRKLQLSVLLANHVEAVVKIIFNTKNGYHEVNAPVWGATDKYILLSNGSFIPMDAVARISLD